LGDRGYDAESIRQGLGDRGIIPFLAKRNTEHGSGLGPMALGCGTDLRMVEPAWATAGALRKAGAHSQGVLALGVCPDLLALPAI